MSSWLYGSETWVKQSPGAENKADWYEMTDYIVDSHP